MHITFQFNVTYFFSFRTIETRNYFEKLIFLMFISLNFFSARLFNMLQNIKKVNGYKEQKIYWALELTQGSNSIY